MKTKLIPLLAAVLLWLGGSVSHAATIQLQDTVLGRRVQTSNFPTYSTLHTMHYYFITAFAGGDWSATLDLTVQGSNNTTSLDFDITTLPDATGAISQLDILIYRGRLTGTLQPGRYIILSRPRNSDYDRDGGIVPTSSADSDFDAFHYDLRFTGNVRLDAVWKGNLDGTWTIVTIPEPSAITGAVIAGVLMVLRRRKHSLGHGDQGRSVRALALLLLVCGPASFETARAQSQVCITSPDSALRQGRIEWVALKGILLASELAQLQLIQNVA